jgi:hypothetical protein
MHTKYLKIILIPLLLICLIDMPYGYFQFVRWFAMFTFAYLAFEANNIGKKNEAFIYVGLLILFQPFLKIALGRTIWNLVDVLVATGLLIMLFKRKV